MRKTKKPALFIASSAESIETAHAVEESLKHDAYVTVWSEGVFDLTRSTLENLLDKLQVTDFAVFVFEGNDLVNIRHKRYQQVRDNVLFELGLFMGHLGRARCFIIAPANFADVRFPTDLAGVLPAKFDPHRPDKNLIAAIGNECGPIRRQIRALGKRRQSTTASKVDKDLLRRVRRLEKRVDELSVDVPTLDYSVRQVKTRARSSSAAKKPKTFRVVPVR